MTPTVPSRQIVSSPITSQSQISFFEGATRSHIENSPININVQHNTTKRSGFDLLLEYCCLDARLDSNERFDPPRCAEGTRIAAIKDVMDWISSDNYSASIMVSHGPAGCGKSALEQSIAERCKREGRLAGAFFLSRTSPNARRADGNTVIPTLVYQLARSFPWFKERVVKVIEDDPGLFNDSRMSLMERLVVDIFKSYEANLLLQRPATIPQPSLIAIDGLDECNDKAIQCDLLRVIATTLPRLPYPFRFLIACRPESHLMRVINHDPSFRVSHIRLLDLGKALNVDGDIWTFLTDEFHKIRTTHLVGHFLPDPWPSANDVSTLVTKASGQFIYADTAIRFVGSPDHHPDERLKVVFGLSGRHDADNPFAQLDLLYAHIFSQVKDLDLVWRVLGIIYILRKSYIAELRVADLKPADLEPVFSGVASQSDIILAFNNLASVVAFSTDSRLIKVQHASLFDFLLDKPRSGPYALDLGLAHETLALWRWEQITYSSAKTTIAAIRKFVHHCRLAPSSKKLLSLIGPLSLSLEKLFDTPHDEIFEGFNAYDRLLVDLSILLGRKDIPHESTSYNLICAVAARWKTVAAQREADAEQQEADTAQLEAVATRRQEDPTHCIFHLKLFKAKWPDLPIFSSKVQQILKTLDFSCLKEDPSLLPKYSSLTKGNGPTETGVLQLQQAALKELVGGPVDYAEDVQRAVCAMRLLFWEQRFHLILMTPYLFSPVVDLPAKSIKSCIADALLVLRHTASLNPAPRIDASLFLFVATLLPLCKAACEDDEVYLDHSIVIQLSTDPETTGPQYFGLHEALGQGLAKEFPTIWRYFDCEASACVQRLKAGLLQAGAVLQKQKATIAHPNSANWGLRIKRAIPRSQVMWT